MARFTKLPLVADTPKLMERWDEELNSSLEISPKKITVGARSVAWWRCTNGLDHSFKGKAYYVNKGQGCAVCRGLQVWPGFNDFESNYPYQSSKWNYIFNDKKPSDVAKSSHKYFWFICDEGHHFRVKLNDIHNYSVWCSYCSGNRIWPQDEVDLQTTHPDLSQQIHPDSGVDPTTIGRGTVRKIKWVCNVDPDHHWTASPNSRTNMGSGCPKCVPKRSKAEVELFEWISKELVPDLEVIANDPNALKCRKHIDIYVPSIRFGVEYNGNYWHKDKGDPEGPTRWKEERARSLGIKLITIWEDEWKADPDRCRNTIRIGLAEHYILI